MRLVIMAVCIALTACTDIDNSAIEAFKEACSGQEVSISAELTTGTWGESLTMRCEGAYGEYECTNCL